MRSPQLSLALTALVVPLALISVGTRSADATNVHYPRNLKQP